MIDFGMPTLIELPEIEDCAKLCNKLNLQFIEINMNLPQYQFDTININKLLKTADTYHIYYTIHMDENFNPYDFNSLVANAYKQSAYQVIEIAKKLSAPVINMHLPDGVYFTMPDKKIYLFNEYKDTYLLNVSDFTRSCEDAINDSSIKICIENTNGYRDFHTQAICTQLASSAFGLTFDIGHNHSIGGNDEPIILNHENQLYHFHFHDAIGNKNHLPLGTGEIDLLKYYCLAYKTCSRVVLETKTIDGLNLSVEWVKKQIKRCVI